MVKVCWTCGETKEHKVLKTENKTVIICPDCGTRVTQENTLQAIIDRIVNRAD